MQQDNAAEKRREKNLHRHIVGQAIRLPNRRRMPLPYNRETQPQSGSRLSLLCDVAQLPHAIVRTSNFGELTRDDFARRTGQSILHRVLVFVHG